MDRQLELLQAVDDGTVDPIAFEELQDLDTDGEQVTPQIVLYASGEVSAGALLVLSRDSGDLLWRLEWDLLGRFELLRKGEPDEEA